MVSLRRPLLRRLLLSAMLALLLFLSSFWLPQSGGSRCGGSGEPCFSQSSQPPVAPARWAEPDEAPPLIKDCPGQSFQARLLLLHLRSSLSQEDDVLLDAYLQGWDQLLRFMESLGSMVSLFSQKVKEKVDLIRQLSIKQPSKDDGKSVHNEAYRSVRSMVEAELKEGVVSFSHRTDSGCRTLLRLHRSLLWLKLMLEGLSEGPDAEGRYRTPGELCREAYQQALAPHHPWFLQRAAELVFLALPERRFFLQLVCVERQEEATPTLRVLIHALTQVHGRTQRILEQNRMLELP
ncbi:ceramide-1-phosphate transfer protein [Salarias fasciatus]|uniref:ceramide-1-phosphate transfer protein n=1 Tax=Salarias fasciatus TaxID=181472 RepID=UPI00117685B3|nr:ceramide-1-phosphate transfer protein-like [Salarias fasciatus]